jgi:raffinose/stachyose/melibiose transport system permease protein
LNTRFLVSLDGDPLKAQTQLLSTWMYFLTYNYNQVGLGTAIAVVLFSLTLIFAIPYIRFMTRKA